MIALGGFVGVAPVAPPQECVSEAERVSLSHSRMRSRRHVRIACLARPVKTCR